MTKKKTTSPKKNAPKKKNGLYCALILDESGSMNSLRQATLDGANAWIADQCAEGPDDLFTLVTFDAPEPTPANYQKVRFIIDGVPLRNVRELGYGDYTPGGWTNLYDAIGLTIGKIKSDPRAKGRGVVLVVMTDGLENKSQEYKTRESISAKIAEVEAEGWVVLYMGGHIEDAKSTVGQFGSVQTQGFANNYTPTYGGSGSAYAASSNATSFMRSSMNKGMASQDIFAGVAMAAAATSDATFVTPEARAKVNQTIEEIRNK